MSKDNKTLVESPIILTGKESQDILDYNFFAEVEFPKIKEIKKINELEIPEDRINFIPLNDRDVYIVKKENLKSEKNKGEINKNIRKNIFNEFESKEMNQLMGKAIRFANKDVNMLITGPSGTGKTSLARFLHSKSLRKNKPFININCTTIPENLIESELFGYKKGAFTGALSSGKKGLVELAEEGTLFLDEIGEMPIALQAKLLELVQEKTYLEVGGVSKKKANIRIIAATNTDLNKKVEEGSFREDLYYRLRMVQIEMPPLKGRDKDIDILMEHFLEFFNKKYETNIILKAELIEGLKKYSWPGNIRELEYLIEYLIINSRKGALGLEDLPLSILKAVKKEDDEEKMMLNISVKEGIDYYGIISDTESFVVNSFYKKFNSSYKLAKALGISQSTANRLINKYI